MLFFPSYGLNFAYGWISSGLAVFMTLEWCYLRAKFIVTAPSRISSMNLQSRLIVNPECAWIGSLASVSCQKKAQGFCDWFSLLTVKIAGNAFIPLIGCWSFEFIILPCYCYFLLWFNHISLWCLIICKSCTLSRKRIRPSYQDEHSTFTFF